MIVVMEEEHLDEVLMIEKQCFKSGAWSKEAYLNELNNEYSTLYVEVIDNRVCGVCGYYVLFDQAQIITIATDPQYQGQGIAKRLMMKAESDFRDQGCEFCTLEVRVTNNAAIKLYQSFGYQEVSVRKQYYEDGEDAYVFAKAL